MRVLVSCPMFRLEYRSSTSNQVGPTHFLRQLFNWHLIRIGDSQFDVIDGDLSQGFDEENGAGISGQGILVSGKWSGGHGQFVETAAWKKDRDLFSAGCADAGSIGRDRAVLIPKDGPC